MRLQLADSFSRGLSLAHGKADLPREIYDALEPLAERVDEAMFEGNAARLEARVKPPWAQES